MKQNTQEIKYSTDGHKIRSKCYLALSYGAHQLPSNIPSIDGALVDTVKFARDLDMYIDFDLLMRIHVSRCFVVLRQLRQIRRSVPTDTFQTLVVGLVLTCLYFGNSVLAGLPVYLVRNSS